MLSNSKQTIDAVSYAKTRSNQAAAKMFNPDERKMSE